MTALTKIYEANLDITTANIANPTVDVRLTTYIRIPVVIPETGVLSIWIGGWDVANGVMSAGVPCARLRALPVQVAGGGRSRARTIDFFFDYLQFGALNARNDLRLWAGRNAANELLLSFEVAIGPAPAASAEEWEDVRNVDPHPLAIYHTTFTPEDSFNLPTTDDSAAIVDSDLMVMLPADVSGQTRVNPVMQSWADLKADVGAATSGAVATNTAAIATNATGIAANLATLNALPDYGPPGLVADFTVTAWQRLDQDDGVTPGQEYWRWNSAPSPTGAVAAGADLTLTPGTVARTIARVQWFDAGNITFYGEQGTEATWGTDFTGNSELSLYIFYDGLPAITPRVQELTLASGASTNWGTSATGVRWTVAVPAGITNLSDIRFLIANKGELDRIAVFVGAQHPYPTYTRQWSITRIGNVKVQSSATNNVLYDSGNNIPYDNAGGFLGTNAQFYGIRANCGPIGGHQQLYGFGTLFISGEQWHALGANTVTSGTTTFMQLTMYSMWLSTGLTSGFAIIKGTGNRIFIASIGHGATVDMRMELYRHDVTISTS